MTATIGIYFVIAVLAMIPLTLIGAGKDTTHKRAERKERQKEALLEWTDKDAVHGELSEKKTAALSGIRTNIPVEVVRITREGTNIQAA